MSKGKRRSAMPEQPHLLPGFVRGQVNEVEDLIRHPDLGEKPLPAAVTKAVHELTYDVGRCLAREMTEFQTLAHEDWAGVYGLLCYCIEQGFNMALYRYAAELGAVPELKAWRKARRNGGDIGRAKQATRKQTRQAEAKAMLNAGLDEKTIAAHFGVDRSTVYRWLQPAASPPASKTKTKPRRK